MKDPNTRAIRYGLYGLLLGHCGRPEDAKAMRAMLDDPDGGPISGRDGVLAGYVMLDPKGGWEYVRKLVERPRQGLPPGTPASARSASCGRTRRASMPAGARCSAAMKEMIDQPDLADLPIDDLWKWKRWELTPNVLAYSAKESHTKYPIINRAILRFSIAATIADPKNTAGGGLRDGLPQERPADRRVPGGQVLQGRDEAATARRPRRRRI